MKFDTIEQLFEFAPPKPLGRAENLSGKVFSHLSPIHRCEYGKNCETYWACKCDCGKYTIVRANHMKQGKITSCGCFLAEDKKGRNLNWKPNHKDLSGQTFGCLTAIEFTGTDSCNHAIWNCKCSCGNYATVTATHLLTGHTRSCGCNRQSQYEKRVKNWLEENGFTYEREVTYKELGRLRFDFKVHLDRTNYVLIEVQGQQHFKPSSMFGGKEAFQKLIENDKRKVDFCEEKGIVLLVINYNDPIEEILTKKLNDYRTL